MLDALNRVKRYRELAKGCRRLAAIGFSAETQNHFLRMAEHYKTLAEAEKAKDTDAGVTGITVSSSYENGSTSTSRFPIP